MQIINISKEDNDALQEIYTVRHHYDLLQAMIDRELSILIISKIFPSVGLTKEDFPFCNIKIDQGKIEFDEEKKAKFLEEQKGSGGEVKGEEKGEEE